VIEGNFGEIKKTFKMSHIQKIDMVLLSLIFLKIKIKWIESNLSDLASLYIYLINWAVQSKKSEQMNLDEKQPFEQTINLDPF
jgi:hypothetical protein